MITPRLTVRSGEQRPYSSEQQQGTASCATSRHLWSRVGREGRAKANEAKPPAQASSSDPSKCRDCVSGSVWIPGLSQTQSPPSHTDEVLYRSAHDNAGCRGELRHCGEAKRSGSRRLQGTKRRQKGMLFNLLRIIHAGTFSTRLPAVLRTWSTSTCSTKGCCCKQWLAPQSCCF
jgi:hypothetical protein